MDLERVDRITADAIGEPGSRTFYLQMRSGPDVVSVILEKEQLRLLAASIDELLSQVGRHTQAGEAEAGGTEAGTEARGTEAGTEPDLGLEQPVEPLWRVGRLSIGYHEELDLVLLEVEELVAGDEEDEEGTAPVVEPVTKPRTIRVWATREQMVALSRHGAAVVAAGRPLCQLCGNPLDPTGHVCPAMNGHGSPSA